MQPYQLGYRDTNKITIKSGELIFLCLLCMIAVTLYISLYLSSSLPLVLITFPLVLYNRAFLFPLFITLSLSQGAFSEATSGVGTADASYAESLSIILVAPLLFYDLTTKKSKTVPYRFVVFYFIFIIFIYQGIIVYYQHPENYLALTIGRYSAIPHSIIKSIKVIFYLFYLRVLINYPLSRNLKTLEVTRRCAPFIIIPLGIYLLVNGRVQNGVGYSGTLQLGDAHHGVFTSELCALSIYLFITLFSRKPHVKALSKFIAFCSIVLVGMMIMVMGSRNGLVCFALVCCIGVFIHLKRRSMSFQFLVVSVGGVAAIIAVILSLQSPTVERAIYMMNSAGGGDRVYYWTAGLKVLEKHPLFGLGGDETASIAAVQHYSPVMVADRVMHNTYLEMAVEYGLIAAVFYIIFVVFVLTWGYRLYKLGLDKQNLLLAAPTISYFIIIFANMFVSNVWGTPSWYNMSLIFAIAIQTVYPAYINKKKAKTFSPRQQPFAQTSQSLPTVN